MLYSKFLPTDRCLHLPNMLPMINERRILPTFTLGNQRLLDMLASAETIAGLRRKQSDKEEHDTDV